MQFDSDPAGNETLPIDDVLVAKQIQRAHAKIGRRQPSQIVGARWRRIGRYLITSAGEVMTLGVSPQRYGFATDFSNS